MRISKKVKEENREKILAIAANFFLEKGYRETTTRDIAVEAGMATGTMFNYFSNKEALAMTLVSTAFSQGRKVYSTLRNGKEGFAEDLFLLITSELRQLKKFRQYIGPVLESGLSLFPRKGACEEGEQVREEHLLLVVKSLKRHGVDSASLEVLTHLYWPLYLGIIAFWIRDESENQEETLAFIDYSLHLYSQTLTESPLRQGELNGA